MRDVMTDFLVFIDIRLLYAAYPPPADGQSGAIRAE